MGPFAATNLPPTFSHCQFGLELVTIELLRLVTVGDNLPRAIRRQPMIVIIYVYYSKKEMSFHMYVHAE